LIAFSSRRATVPSRHGRANALIAEVCGGFSTAGKDLSVKFQIVFAAIVAASLISPLAAQAQGIPDGVAHGAYVGNNAAGPVGAVVGGAVGGVIGGINGVLGIGPSYAAYPAGESRAYRHRVRHAYHHAHYGHPTS
jgi:hypothetical protein